MFCRRVLGTYRTSTCWGESRIHYRHTLKTSRRQLELQETCTMGLSYYSLISGDASLARSPTLLSLQTESGTFTLKQPESKKAFSSQKRISRSTNLNFRNLRLKSRPSIREPGGYVRVFASKTANLNHATESIDLISYIYCVICSVIPHYRLESASPCSLSNYTSQTYSSV
jgi:hypothetical protein